MNESLAKKPPSGHSLTIRELKPFYGKRQVVKATNFFIPPQQITALIGPSGCGKSTILRCMNRMHEMVEGASVEGSILLDDEDVYQVGVDARLVRRKIGMIFQQPIVLLTRSIYENVAIGPRMSGVTNRSLLDEIVEKSLRATFLWDEVKDRLLEPGRKLSGGQQQRLSIARSLAIEPDVLLFDEPCSALDPITTSKIEDLLLSLRETYTIVIVTHNLQQAARISDWTAFFMLDLDEDDYIGMLVEHKKTEELFQNPQDSRTKDYISGRMG